jgi:hypothetical protein
MILQMGLLSTETRFTNGIGMHGLSSNHDFNYGSVDSVFTQILTERHGNPDDLGYSGSIRLLFSLEALESGTYQSMDDSFGSRLVKHPHYLERPGIVEFIDQFEASSGARGHEIMIKERIDPSYIKGILVAEERIRKQLVDFMRTKELIERDTTGRETLFGRVLDEFIRVRPERVA